LPSSALDKIIDGAASFAHSRAQRGITCAPGMQRLTAPVAGPSLARRTDMTKLASFVAFGLLAIPACVASSSDDVRSVEQSIVGGQTVNPTEYPSVVALEDSPGNWFCTGTLISSDWVLTAAHCVADGPTTGLNVRFDDPDVNDAAGGIVVAISEVHAHPDFDWEAWDNDIALLRLATPVTDRTPTPIHRDQVAAATQVIDVGYGVADNQDNGGGLLRSVDKVTADCAGANDPTVSGDVLICMDANDGRGSCFGDSGGPTFARINGSLVVAGVTSGGTGDLCGAGWDLYTSVFAELSFVDTTISAPPTDPGMGNPDPMNPDPDGVPRGDDDEDDDGGCSTGNGHGAGTLLLAAFATFFARRRRR
jgi:MYXO-CTERM domain-containing protein